MKNIFLLFIAWVGFGIVSCNQRAENQGTADTTQNNIIPPKADNSQATNPSLADTAFAKKDSMNTGRNSDSVK